jgi:hypothetical protein
VAITASADIVSAGRAAVIGGVGAAVMLVVTIALERAQVDDAIGAVPVHLGAGVWGTLAVALLGDVEAFPDASNRIEQVGIQLVGIGVCFLAIIDHFRRRVTGRGSVLRESFAPCEKYEMRSTRSETISKLCAGPLGHRRRRSYIRRDVHTRDLGMAP